MNYKMIGRIISMILLIEAVFMIPAMILGFCYGESNAAMAFLISILLIAAVAGGMYWYCRGAKKGFFAKEGLVCVGLSWIVLSLFGCLPFFISREIPQYIDAFFEIVSGFTTTGSSIVPEVEKLSKCILYWRSFSHWLGGMGVLVFLLAITSISGGNGYTMHILRAESPGPNVGKLVPKMRRTAEIMYLLYVVLTLINIFFLVIGKMPVFEAVCTAFGTAGTGGFGIKNDSMASYSPYLQNVTTIFMFVFSINFSVYYLILVKQFRNAFRDEELHLFLGIAFFSIVLIVWNLRGFYPTMGETIRHAAFQVSTIMSTTGYATTDFDKWPSFSKGILIMLMIIGASAGSTGGGFKVGRLLFMLKNLRRNVRQMIDPRKVQVVRNNGQVLDEKILANVNSYVAAYMLITIVSFLLVSLDGFSITTNFTAVLTCFNNVGPGLDQVGPVCNFAGYSGFSKFVLIMDMLAGRLEIFPIMVLFFRSTWVHK